MSTITTPEIEATVVIDQEQEEEEEEPRRIMDQREDTKSDDSEEAEEGSHFISKEDESSHMSHDDGRPPPIETLNIAFLEEEKEEVAVHQQHVESEDSEDDAVMMVLEKLAATTTTTANQEKEEEDKASLKKGSSVQQPIHKDHTVPEVSAERHPPQQEVSCSRRRNDAAASGGGGRGPGAYHRASGGEYELRSQIPRCSFAFGSSTTFPTTEHEEPSSSADLFGTLSPQRTTHNTTALQPQEAQQGSSNNDGLIEARPIHDDVTEGIMSSSSPQDLEEGGGGGSRQTLPIANPFMVQRHGRTKSKRRQADVDTQRRNSCIHRLCGWCIGILGILLVGAIVVLALTHGDGSSNKQVPGAPPPASAAAFPNETSSKEETMSSPLLDILIDGLPDHTQEAILLAINNIDDSSPQAMAYEWVKGDPFLGNYSQSQLRQKFALSVFYFSTGGPNWKIQGKGNKAWLSYPNVTAAAADNEMESARENGTSPYISMASECQWLAKGRPKKQGKKQQDDRITNAAMSVARGPSGSGNNLGDRPGMTSGNVDELTPSACNERNEYVSIWLYENNLQGTLPQQLALLETLQQIKLGGNDLRGTIPSTLFSNLKNLTSIGIRGSQLSGTIPAQIGLATNLNKVFLLSNQLTGTLPDTIFNSTNLRSLHLRCNFLSGTLPHAVGNLHNKLEMLHLGKNQFVGRLPSQLGLLTQLDRIHLSMNEFTGNLPSQIGLLRKLQTLDIQYNRLHGRIPDELGQLTQLTRLTLGGNPGLTGTLPQWIGDIANLTTFRIEGCSLTGLVPSWLGNVSYLQHLNLQDNQFTGVLPTELGLLTSLVALDLSSNPEVTGPFPQTTNFTALEYMNLTGTSVSGTIPESLCGIEIHFDCSDML